MRSRCCPRTPRKACARSRKSARPTSRVGNSVPENRSAPVGPAPTALAGKWLRGLAHLRIKLVADLDDGVHRRIAIGIGRELGVALDDVPLVAAVAGQRDRVALLADD